MIRYAITDRTRYGAEEQVRCEGLVRQAARLAQNGVGFVQLREKDLTPAAMVFAARAMMEAFKRSTPVNGRRPRLVINSRADVAIAAGADGVHLPSSPGGVTVAQVRELFRLRGLAAPVVSLSCHTLADVREAVSRGPDGAPDLILFGPVFEKRLSGVERLAGSGLDLLAAACAEAGAVPVLALGGVTEETVPECLAGGAAGVAAIRMFPGL